MIAQRFGFIEELEMAGVQDVVTAGNKHGFHGTNLNPNAKDYPSNIVHCQIMSRPGPRIRIWIGRKLKSCLVGVPDVLPRQDFVETSGRELIIELGQRIANVSVGVLKRGLPGRLNLR